MPPLESAELELACRVVSEVKRGERASVALASSIASERLGPRQAEQLAALVYGALRRERRVREGLEQSGAVVDDAVATRLTVVGAALLDGALLDLAAARAAWSEVSWQRFLEADRRLLEEGSPVARVALLGSLPDFLAERLLAEYGEQAEALAASLSEPAPRALRANSLKVDRAELQARLGEEGAQTRPGRFGQRCLILEGAFDPFATRAFHAGLFELQDEGSQIACELVAAPPRGLVVDACAGAGGKSLSLAAALEGRGKLVALDVDERKLVELRRRAKRAGAVNVQALAIEETGPLPPAVASLTGKVDRLLVDAPCSGTGVLRRNPEARSRLSQAAIERLVVTQRAIVERLLPLLAPGGRLVFVTCSLLRAEGEDLLDSVEAAHPELQPVNLAEIFDRKYIERFPRSAPGRVRLLPHLHATDGFFVSVLRRRR
jgi:16S rRNA (cytosine967-C5)-methyltransferase